jgi:diguanylate cyclase (GGDEF)-like protein
LGNIFLTADIPEEKRALKVLIADDDPMARLLLETHLRKWGHEVVVSEDGEQAWGHLEGDDPPKLAILDWMMPKRDGLDICTALRASGSEPYVYVIFLTSKSSQEDIVRGLEAGADDYIVKPFDYNELRTRVRAGARIIKLQDDLIAALKESEFQASHDSLTTLLNRSAILEMLGRELKRAEREETPLSVIIADIDHFKAVNDSYGHIVGDQVLKATAVRLASFMRPYDFCGRYGGEEFLLVVPGCTKEMGVQVAERLRVGVSRRLIETTGGPVQVTLSLGVAEAEQPRDVDGLIKHADDALYRAKRQGRNRTES